MRFLKQNFIALLMVFALIISEYFYLLFEGMPFNDNVNLDAAVFYFTFSFFGSGLLVSIMLLLQTDSAKIASKAIFGWAIFWNLIETWENFCYLAKINSNVLFVNDWSWIQTSSLAFLMAFIIYGFIKSKS